MKNFFLYLLSLAYGFGVAIRNGMFNINILHSREFSVPVISVGNITVGGTGKTPHTEYLIQLLSKNYRIAVLSRGYKRKSKGFLLVETSSTILQVGDEPLQIKRKFPSVLVAVDEKRIRGIEKLLEVSEMRPDVILMDDAFQHRYVNPAINILLIDYTRMITQDSLLPLGRLREPASARERAHIIIITKSPINLKPIDERIISKDLNIWPYQNLFFSRMEYGSIQPLFPEINSKGQLNLNDVDFILLLTGIANAFPLKEYLQKEKKSIIHLEYPDHFIYGSKEIDRLAKQFIEITAARKIILTTEKDGVRIFGMENIPDEVKENIYSLPVKVKFVNTNENEFDQKILKYVGENKSNFELHYEKNRR